jgi:putative ABC transport system permease protein
MSQFLLEAVTLSLVGSLLGIIAGMSSIEILKHTAGTIPNYKVMLLGAGGGVAFSALLGIVSGYLPAKKAGKLDPADAMRFE